MIIRRRIRIKSLRELIHVDRQDHRQVKKPRRAHFQIERHPEALQLATALLSSGKTYAAAAGMINNKISNFKISKSSLQRWWTTPLQAQAGTQEKP